MKILFLHGWTSTPGGVKPAYLKSHGHEVLNPALPDEDFDEAVRVAQAEFDRGKPDVVVGSSRGGAVAMNIASGSTPLVLLCPAWKRWGSATTVKPNTVILHSPADETIPFAESQELLRNSGLPESAITMVGTDHRLADAAPLEAMLKAAEAAGAGTAVPPKRQSADRITRWLLIVIGIYSVLLVGLLNAVILNSDKARDRAIFMMADGMILLWIIVGGSLTPLLRRRLVPRIAAIPIDWRVRFVLFCTAMALIEEIITTTMTNLAPVFGSTPEEAHITASTNYFHVVLCHSVVLFFFMFIIWAWMLARWDISPPKVLLLFGITGSLAEATLNPTSLIAGFWVFVYGLMVYLPACTVPRDRGAKPLRWWHCVLAVFLPLLGVIPGGLAATILRRLLDVHFLPGVQ
jgi:hypothetical protein